MKKQLLKKTIFMLTFMCSILLWQNITQAATMSISASKTSVNPGEQVTITVSSDCTGRINLGTTAGTLSNNSVWIEGNSQSVTLTANSAGTITVTAQPVTLASSSGDEVSIPAKSCNVKVATNSTQGNNSNNGSSNNNNNNGNSNQTNNTNSKSNVATLANLGINPNDFKGFSPSKTSYSVTVPNSVSNINIYASKGQSGQTISGTGSKSLREGANQFNVTVTAEDGKTTKTYTLSVTREATEDKKDSQEDNEQENKRKEDEVQEDEKDTQDEDKKKEIGLSALKIEDINLEPNFKKDIYEYRVNLTEDKSLLNINTEPLSQNQKVEIIGNEDLKEGENLITILVSDENGENTATYQIIVDKKLENKEEIDNKGTEKKKRIIIIASLSVIIIIVAVILIIRYVRYKRDIEEFSETYFDQEEDIFSDKGKQKEKLNNVEEDLYDEKPKKKGKSKGKRFK